jgi:DNA-binding GntR family transcriptional regulator
VPLSAIKLPGERSRADELYEWLYGAILSGELRPSERLVETTIAELASVSRTPVREALHRLEVDGLVNQGSNGLEVNGFSLDELSDLCAVRETLEGMAGELAAAARSSLELETLRRITAEETEMVGEAQDDRIVARRVELNHLFHETIWRASRNHYLAGELQTLRGLIERRQDSTLREPERHGEAVAEHIAILHAIEARDADEAGALSRAHFRHAMAIRLLGRAVDQPRA